MKAVPLVGRILFAAIFIVAGFGHFSRTTIDYAAVMGVPAAGFLVPFAGLLAVVGGFMVLLGYRGKVGAWMLAVFLLPVTFMMHQFWAVSDPLASLTQQIMFMKNLAMLGGALMIAYFGTGPYSIDAWIVREPRVSDTLAARNHMAARSADTAAVRAEARALDTDLDTDLSPDLRDVNIDRSEYAKRKPLIRNERDSTPRDLH